MPSGHRIDTLPELPSVGGVTNGSVNGLGMALVAIRLADPDVNATLSRGSVIAAPPATAILSRSRRLRLMVVVLLGIDPAGTDTGRDTQPPGALGRPWSTRVGLTLEAPQGQPKVSPRSVPDRGCTVRAEGHCPLPGREPDVGSG